MKTRELLEAATPRPWTTTGGDRYGSVASTDPAAIKAFLARWPRSGLEDVDAYGGALVGESILPADRALIVAAVNEYEALLDVVDAIAAADPLITVNGETKMPRECWLRIEGAMLAANREAPIVGVIWQEDDE